MRHLLKLATNSRVNQNFWLFCLIFYFSVNMGETFKNIGIQELLEFQQLSDIWIIDVREPSEISATGELPKSINIPTGEVSEALSGTAEDFKCKYSRDKPEKTSPLVFSCRSGRRSAAASKIAEELGYVNVNNFSGGWLAWEEYLKSQ